MCYNEIHLYERHSIGAYSVHLNVSKVQMSTLACVDIVCGEPVYNQPVRECMCRLCARTLVCDAHSRMRAFTGAEVCEYKGTLSFAQVPTDAVRPAP